jgi:hypothetical protein
MGHSFSMGARGDSKQAALGACLCAAALGCGDIGDAQLPLPVYGGGARESTAERELTPDPFAAEPAHAVASVAVSATAGGDCPIAFEALLPDPSASQTVVTGWGARAIDGEGAQIACHVLAAPDSPGVFDVILSLRHPGLSWLRATGRVEPGGPLEPSGASASGMLALRLTTPDAAEVTADCPIEVDAVLSGAVWFHSLACQTLASEPRAGACDVTIRAIFEHCGQ